MRLFSPMWRSTAYSYLSMTEYSGLSGSGTTKGGAATLLTTHATYPVNFVLFYSGYQSNYTNVSPTQAVSLVTSAACAKLKADHPTTLRVYVIKYRKQEMYNAIPIKGETSKQYHDYSIVDQCATSGKVYEATTQASLKSTLDTIAADIKICGI